MWGNLICYKCNGNGFYMAAKRRNIYILFMKLLGKNINLYKKKCDNCGYEELITKEEYEYLSKEIDTLNDDK